MMVFWALTAWLGCTHTLYPPDIEAPLEVLPTGPVEITVSSRHNGDLVSWWSIDGEYQDIEAVVTEQEQPAEGSMWTVTVDQEEPTDGEQWTVIVQQEVDGMLAPPARAHIDIVQEADDPIDDTGSAEGSLVGSSPEYPAESCDDVSDTGSGVYWFAPAGPIADPYKARCEVVEGVAWMQVLTVNGDDGEREWSMTADQWGQRCESLETGTDTKGVGAWSNGYEASGYNPGVCALRVNRVRICPEDGSQRSCYITPEFEEPVESLHWALNGGEAKFSEGVSVGPNFGDPNDFMSRCEDAGVPNEPDSGLGEPVPSVSLEWFVGDGGAARIGFAFNIDFGAAMASIIFGVGVPDSLGMGAGSYVDDALTEGCGTDASVWIR